MNIRFSVPMVLSLALVAATACSDGGESSADEPSQAPEAVAAAPGKVRGMIAYAGEKRGMVKLALFRTYPPTGAPVASGRVDATAFPLAYELPSPAGHYTLVAFLDVTNDGSRPTPDDVSAAPVEIDIPAGGAQTFDLQLAP